MSSVSRSVDLTSNGIGNNYLRDVDHGSLSSTSQDRIFHIMKSCLLRTFEVLNKHDFILSIQQSNSKIGEKKNFYERNGESDRSGDKSSSFIVNKARISVQLQLQVNSLRKGVVCLEAWI